MAFLRDAIPRVEFRDRKCFDPGFNQRGIPRVEFRDRKCFDPGFNQRGMMQKKEAQDHISAYRPGVRGASLYTFKKYDRHFFGQSVTFNLFFRRSLLFKVTFGHFSL